MKKVIIVFLENHSLLLKKLLEEIPGLFEKFIPGNFVLKETQGYEKPEEFIEVLQKLDADEYDRLVLFVDGRIGGGKTGSSYIEQILHLHPSAKIVSMSLQEELNSKAVEKGAHVAILKNLIADEESWNKIKEIL